jgi:hypothetical protein
VRLAGRVRTEPEALELFACSLAATDRVALEATGNALAIARIIEPYVDRVLPANRKAVKGVTQAAKTDKIDARTLPQPLAGGFLPEVWIVDEPTRMLRRRVAGRARLLMQLHNPGPDQLVYVSATAPPFEMPTGEYAYETPPGTYRITSQYLPHTSPRPRRWRRPPRTAAFSDSSGGTIPVA